MGLLVDMKKARHSMCTCYYIGDKDLRLPKLFDKSIQDVGIRPEEVMCFSEGFVGTLSDDEDREYCNGGIIKESERLKNRLQCFSACAKKC